VTAIDFGSTWRYFDRGAAPDEWHRPTFDDAGWASGPGRFGFGDGDQRTAIARLVDGTGLHTAYFRNSFTLDGGPVEAVLEMAADDGAVVWVNGNRVVNDNMTSGPVDYWTLSSTGRWGSAERQIRSFTIPAVMFQAGENTVAVEVHQRERWSSDLRFEARLTLTLDQLPD
jgi:hypothetical protein